MISQATTYTDNDLRSEATGVILAGGLARRMGNIDKGLIELKGQPMVHYALRALKPVVKDIVINANRNQDRYARFGYPVIADKSRNFDGPLAGILSTLLKIESRYLVTVPCDSPLISSDMLKTLINGMKDPEVEICVADDGDRIHPVFLVLKTSLVESLKNYLATGKRKIDTWLYQHHTKEIDFSGNAHCFQNVNTADELAMLETKILP